MESEIPNRSSRRPSSIASGDKVELRKLTRYPLGVPAFFSWIDQRGISQQGEGVTRDISAEGVFLFASTLPPVGSVIRFEISLPPLPGAVRRLRIEAEGRVLRLEPAAGEKEWSGFAAVTEGFVLEEVKLDCETESRF